MRIVLLGLLPGCLLQVSLLGRGYLENIALALLIGYLTEFLALWLRGRSPNQGLRDGSVWITALLITLALPPQTPAGIVAIAVVTGLGIGKHAYGGLGQNIFNPAMVGYAIVLVSFPADLSLWSTSNYFASGGTENTLNTVDGLTAATTLESFKHRSALTVAEYWQQSQSFGYFGSKGWEWINLAYLLGGSFLIWKQIIAWQMPVAFLLTLTVLSSLGYDSGSSNSLGSPAIHLFSGGTMLFAFFVLTDPVTCPSHPRSRIIFAVLVASLAFAIRTLGAFPDGLAFAILFGNLFAPLIDRYSDVSRPGDSLQTKSDLTSHE